MDAAPPRTRIDRVETAVLSFALERPFRAAIRVIPTVDCVVVRVRTDDGAEGVGTAFAFGLDDARILAGLVDTLGARILGRDPQPVEAIWRDLWDSLVFLGQAGAGISAIAPIDMALWDLKGRRAGLPLYRLLGGACDSVPVYGSGGSLASSTAELAAEMEAHARAGWPAVKLKLGHGIAADRARVAAVRDAVGPEVRIILDGNQQWTAKQAIAVGHALADLDPWWLEEPVPAADLEACAAVRAAVPMAVATGETNFTPEPFDRMIRARAADILMPNLQRVGGITPWRKVAAAAELAGLAVASHVYAEVNVHLMTAVPNGLTLEVIPWWPRLFEESVAISGGRATPPDRPGLGFTLDAGAVARHRVA